MTNREIDALVAEKVMGAAVCSCIHPPKPKQKFDEMTGACLTCGNRKGWAYSTDPAASKQLRDKVHADGWRYVIQALGSSDRFIARFWRVRIAGEDKAGTVLESEDCHDTEELAVALALLKAHGVEVPDA